MSAKALGGLIGFISIAVIAFSITQLVLVADDLYPGNGYYETCYPDGSCYYWYNDGICLMNKLDSSINICKYSYAVSAIALIFALITVFAMCLPPVASMLLMAFQAIWWFAAAVTFTAYYQQVNDQTISVTIRDQTLTRDIPWPRTNYFRMVYALAWTCFCICLAAIPLALMQKKSDGKGAAQAADKPGAQDAAKAAGMPPAGAAV